MTELTHAGREIDSLVALLQLAGGFEFEAHILQSPTWTAPGDQSSNPEIVVELSGADEELLVANNGELVQAIQQVAHDMLRLEPAEHDRLWFDVRHIKLDTKLRLDRLADEGERWVRRSGEPFQFPPMVPCERWLLRRILERSGLTTASSGESHRRSLVLYPHGMQPPPDGAACAQPHLM